MSFGDVYSVPAGQGNYPGVPQIDLPQVEAPPRRPLQLTVGPRAEPADPWEGSGVSFKPADKVAGTAPDEGDPWKGSGVAFKPAEEHVDTRRPPRDVGAGEAFGREAAHSATFGLSPAIAGAISAGRSPEEDQASAEGYQSGHWPSAASELGSLITGLGKLGYKHLIAPALGIEPGDEETDARYQRGREEAQKALEAGREQHPGYALAGGLVGGLATPMPGLGTGAALGTRLLRGAAAGGAGGALYGAGSALSEGKDLGDIGRAGLVEGAIGAGTGGLLHGAIGPRPFAGVPTGEAAARTARDLGAPLPRGVASDSPFVQATTSKLRQIPFAGEGVGARVGETQEAAGRRIGGIASEMTGPAGDRAAADAVMRPALQGVIDTNRATIDAAYDGLRNQIHLGSRFGLPRTRAMLRDIRQNRAEAGWENPGQGLEQFENVAHGTNFNGAHRARVDAREAGNALVPHPGYNAADYNRLTRAMTEDLRAVVQHAARNQTPAGRQAALQAFNEAEREFGRLADQNSVLRKLVDAKGEGAISTLLGAAKEKGGNVALLNQLRRTMSPDDFSTIGGVLLNELGHNNATGEFSLARFVTNWDKTSERARDALFDPQHLRNIEDIVGMGRHIKGALRESSTSHSASMLVLLDVAKDIVSLPSRRARRPISSAATPWPAIGAAGTTAGTWLLTKWLASPASASSMAAWARARALLQASATPARQGVFNIATRNLAHTLGVPVEAVMRAHKEATDG